MRLMLGTKDNPSLLVAVEQEYSPTHFEFWVINGCWKGTFYDGYVTVHGCPSGDYSSLDKVEVLSDNQDRLRCGRDEYNDVFANFHNPDYVAPKPKKVVLPSYRDDDVPF